MNQTQVLAATDRIEQIIAETGRTELYILPADADMAVAIRGNQFVRMLEADGSDMPEIGYAVAHEFVSRRLEEEREQDAAADAADAEAEARARWNAQCDRELDYNSRDLAAYGYIDD